MINQIRDTFFGIHPNLGVESKARVGVITPSTTLKWYSNIYNSLLKTIIYEYAIVVLYYSI